MLVVIAHSFFILHFVVVLHLLMFFIHICFSTSSLTLLWTIAGFLHPFHTFSPAHRRVICDTFIFNHSVIFLPRALRFWVGPFLPTGAFLPNASSLTFYLRLSRPPWEPAVLPWSFQGFILILKTQTRPICLIHSNPQSLYLERFIFKFYQTLSWIACGESLIYLLLTGFELLPLVQSHM